jgi:hypothetical protein
VTSPTAFSTLPETLASRTITSSSSTNALISQPIFRTVSLETLSLLEEETFRERYFRLSGSNYRRMAAQRNWLYPVRQSIGALLKPVATRSLAAAQPTFPISILLVNARTPRWFRSDPRLLQPSRLSSKSRLRTRKRTSFRSVTSFPSAFEDDLSAIKSFKIHDSMDCNSGSRLSTYSIGYSSAYPIQSLDRPRSATSRRRQISHALCRQS